MARSRQYLAWCVISSQVILIMCHFSATDHSHEDLKNPTSSPTPPISDHRFFLHEIFTKYGHDGQMTFEGFEHLLESLGLGNIIINDHDVAAHKEKEFRDTHGTHNHAKKVDHSDTPTGNSATESILESQRSFSSQSPGETATTSDSLSSLNRHIHHNALPTSASEGVELSSQAHSSDPTSDHMQHTHINKTALSNGTHANSESSGNIYHYHLREVKIPELLVNISTLVDQHQELVDRSPDIVIEQCLSPKEILDTFGINQTSSLNPVSFLHLCPAIIYELDQGHCMFRDHSHKKIKSIATMDQWLYSSIAVLLISFCGLLSVAVIPIMQKWFYHTLLQFFVGLAVGTLSGDALLHLMPHAMLGGDAPHDHNGPESSEVAEKTAVWRGLAALGGIFFFFVAERLLGMYASHRKHNKDLKVKKSSKGVSQFHLSELPHNGNVGEKLSHYRKSSYELEMSEKEMMNMLSTDAFPTMKASVENLSGSQVSFPRRPSYHKKPADMSPHSPDSDCAISVPEHHGHGHSHGIPDSVSAVAWMVIMGDGLHNFCDGLAIGAAFASGIEGGISTSVAVFCHELPHELGDFAMLLKTGMKAKQALMYNGLSSVLCFIGMVIGVSLGNVHSATSWVFAGTAGMFLYIALVDMLPELAAPSSDSDSTTAHQLAVQVLGICCGVSIMFVIANYEQDLQNIIS